MNICPSCGAPLMRRHLYEDGSTVQLCMECTIILRTTPKDVKDKHTFQEELERFEKQCTLERFEKQCTAVIQAYRKYFVKVKP